MTQVLNTQGQQSPKTGSAGKHGHQLLTEFYREMLNAIFTKEEDVADGGSWHASGAVLQHNHPKKNGAGRS